MGVKDVQTAKDIVSNESGKLEKMKLTPFKRDKTGKEEANGDPYVVMFNPSNFQRKLSISYSNQQVVGSTHSAGEYKQTHPEKLSFDLIIDGTGATGGDKVDVANNIEKFLSVVYVYEGSIHRPNFVRIEFCGNVFKCKMDSLDISYNMFYPNGKPMRAKLSCAFSTVLDPEKSEKKKNKQSSDITHKFVLKEGETLAGMANSIYESNDYYIDVALKNDLNNFRKIKSGTELYFPPLK